MTQKRFRKEYVLGDTGLIDELSNPKWFIENINSISDLEKNWDTVLDKLNRVWEQTQRFEKHNAQLTEENIRYEEYIEDLIQENKELKKENEELQQKLFESEYECIEVHYHDNEVRRDDRIKMLKEEFKERFGRDFE